MQWSSEDIAFAILLKSMSVRAYRYLRNKLMKPTHSQFFK